MTNVTDLTDITKYRLAVLRTVLSAIFNSSKLFVLVFFIALMYFKVVHHADISWWIVFGPFWMPMALVVGIFLAFIAVIFALMVIAYFVDVANGRA